MSEYLIKTSGCDDETCARVTLTGDEAATIQRVAAALNVRSTYGCKPTLNLIAWADATAYDREAATEPIEED